MPTTKKLLALLSVSMLATYIVAGALTISPARAELTADPGETLSDSFLIINEQDTDQTYYTSVENFDSQGESGTPNFTAGKEGLPTWIKIAEQVTLKKGERIKIPYTIEVPQGADPGGHFAAIFLSTVPPSADQSQVSVGAKVGMLVLLRVTGVIQEGGAVSSFSLQEEKKWHTSLPLTFVYRFNNTGNDRVKPEGVIVVKNMMGSEIANLDANKATGNVLPNSTRRFEIPYGDVKAPEAAAPFFDHVKFQYNNFSFGRYTATLNLKFGNNGTISQSLTYYMLPWQLLTVVLGGLVVCILLFTFMLKRYNKWIINQARHAK